MRKLVNYVINSNFWWPILDATLIRFATYAQWEHYRLKRTPGSEKRLLDANLARAISQDLIVKHGVFKGMRYPRERSSGSPFLPKILGSYERELESIIEQICDRDYSDIINIGCGEGYYAVGLALRIENSLVYAFDSSPEARKLCSEMASMNGVEERIIIGQTCNKSALQSIPLRGKALVISDCEGCEKRLFDKDMIPILKDHDLLIETHDFLDIEISGYLRGLFDATHEVDTIRSIDDIQKAYEYEYPEIESFDLPTRREILKEGRPTTMTWLYMKSRSVS